MAGLVPGHRRLPDRSVRAREVRIAKPLDKIVSPVPDDNRSPKGPGSAPAVPLDTTKAIAMTRSTTFANMPRTATSPRTPATGGRAEWCDRLGSPYSAYTQSYSHIQTARFMLHCHRPRNRTIQYLRSSRD